MLVDGSWMKPVPLWMNNFGWNALDGELDETRSALDEQILDGMRWMETRMKPVPSDERFRLDGSGLLDEQQMKPVPFWMDGWKLDGWMEFG